MKHFFTFILFASFVLRAQSDSSGVDFYEMSLEDLLNVKVSVASAGELTSRESPGIVTLITQEEIKNSGARDLMELLSFVPGVSFHQDVQGSVGIGMRGNWGHEGKILMILDGQELNENLYSTLNFGNHYDLSSIKQIEIIRGPGSSTYGGYAELGVIKITTYSAEEINGLELGATYGQYDKSYARRNVSLSMGKKFNDFSVVYHGFLGQGNRSQDEYSDFYGDSISLVNGLKANPFVSNLGMSYKNLSARFVYDYYENITPIWFDELLPEPLKIRYRNVFGELKYQWKVSEKVSLVPRLAYTNQLPWSNEPTEEAVEFKLQAARITPSVIANFQFSPSVSLMAGGEYFHDVAKNFAEETSPYFDNGTDYISYDNMAVFSQLNVRHKWFNTILGGRYNHHSVFGPSLVPRIGITKIINKFHTKLLYSYAYRSPSIENIVSNEDIIPENTRVLEVEAGYQLHSNIFLTANVFDITILDPIVFSVEEQDSVTILEYYDNLSRTGTRGLEVEVKSKFKWGYLNANYSYNTTAGKNEVELYEVPDKPNQMLGFAAHTVNVMGSMKLSSTFHLNSSLRLIGARNEVSAVDSSETSIFSELDPTWLFSFSIRAKNLLPGLEAQLGVADLFDQRYRFVQPYNSGLANFRSGGREIFIKVNYRLGKNK